MSTLESLEWIYSPHVHELAERTIEAAVERQSADHFAIVADLQAHPEFAPADYFHATNEGGSLGVIDDGNGLGESGGSWCVELYRFGIEGIDLLLACGEGDTIDEALEIAQSALAKVSN